MRLLTLILPLLLAGCFETPPTVNQQIFLQVNEGCSKMCNEKYDSEWDGTVMVKPTTMICICK